MPFSSLFPKLLPTSVLVGVLVAGSAAAQAGPLVELPAGDRYQLQAAGDRAELPIPIEPAAGVAAGELEATLFDARQGERREAVFLDAFRVAVAAPEAGHGPVLRVGVELGPEISAGAYQLLVDLRHPPTSRRQRLALEVLHPAARVRPPGPLVVERVDPELAAPRVVAPALELRETSGRSHLRHATLRQVAARTADRRPVAGRLIFDRVPPIAPGGASEAPYRVAGDFPLGTASGVLELTSPQLESPLEIGFEVRSRRPRWWLLSAVVLGLLCGYLLRTGIQSWVELSELRVRGEELLREIGRERALHVDAGFRTTLDETAEALRGAVESCDRTDLADTVRTSEEQLRAAQADLARRRDEVETELAELQAVVEIPWHLPEAATEPVIQARWQLRAATAELKRGRIESAREAGRDSAERLEEALRKAAEVWCRNELDRLARFRSSSLPLLAPAREALGLARERLKGVRARDSTVGVHDLLPAIDRAQVQLTYLAEDLVRQIRATAETVLELIDPKAETGSEPVVTLRTTLEELRGKVEVSAESPGEVLDLLAEHHLKLEAKLRAAIVDRCAGELPAEVKQHLEHHHFIEAARAAAECPTAEERKRAAPLGLRGGGDVYREALSGSARGEGGEAEERRWPEPEPLPAARVAPAREPATPGWRREPVALEWAAVDGRRSARSWRQLLSLKLGRWVLSAVLLLVIGYLFFAEGFVGSWRELALIFFWAFGLDVGVDAVTEAAGKLRR